MKTQTRLTKHGAERLQSRSSLSVPEIDIIIASGLALNLGREVGSNRVHWLLWSAEDERAFVVIRDERNKELITVLFDAYEGRHGVPPRFVHLAKFLSRFPTYPQLTHADLVSWRTQRPELNIHVISVVCPSPRGGRTSLETVKVPLGELIKLKEPWYDAAILNNIWFKNQDLPGKEHLVLHQMILRLKANRAVKSVHMNHILQRPF